MVLAAFSFVIDVSANEQTLPSFDSRPVEIKERQLRIKQEPDHS